MADSAPLLSDYDHDAENQDGGHIALGSDERTPARPILGTPLRVASIVTTLLSFVVFLLFVGIHIYVKHGPFQSTWKQEERSKDIFIVQLVIAVLTAPTIFFHISIYLTTVANLALAITTTVLTTNLFDWGFPGYDMCAVWRNGPNNRFRQLPGKEECIKARAVLKILWAVGGALSAVVVLLLFLMFLARLYILIKSVKVNQFKFPKFGSLSSATGFTVHLSFSILPVGTVPTIYNGQTAPQSQGPSREEPSAGADERLIET